MGQGFDRMWRGRQGLVLAVLTEGRSGLNCLGKRWGLKNVRSICRLAAEDEAVQARIADAMDARCQDSSQIELRRAYLGGLDLPEGAFAVEFGSGTGWVTRDLIEMAGAARALGIEPSPVMVARAEAHFEGVEELSFTTGDAKATGLEDASVDMVLMHTLLCHVPGPEDVVREAWRVLKPGGLPGDL